MAAQARRASRRGLLEAVRRFQEAALQPAGSWQPQLPLELAFLEALSLAASSGGMPAGAPLAAEPARAPQPVEAAVQPATPQSMAQEPAPAPAPATPQPAPAPAPAAGTPAPEAVPAAAAALTLQTVVGMWHEMVARVGQSKKNLPALLAMCKPLAVEGNAIILGFDYPIFKEKFDKLQGGPGTVIDAFRALSGTECTVRAVVTSEYAVPIRRDEFHALAEELGGIVREE
jgi:hypothetical protein